MDFDAHTTLRVVDIVDGTTVDGPGFRTSIYFAGCCHECPGCHNPSTWSFEAGKDMTIDEIVARVEENGENVTFTGGDPVYRAKALIPLAARLKEKGVTIWMYTGFHYEDLLNNPICRQLFEYVDVLVDGPYIDRLRDISLLFRGSSNQRLIDLRKSTADSIKEWESDF